VENDVKQLMNSVTLEDIENDIRVCLSILSLIPGMSSKSNVALQAVNTVSSVLTTVLKSPLITASVSTSGQRNSVAKTSTSINKTQT
jgi:hypothetical protein